MKVQVVVGLYQGLVENAEVFATEEKATDYLKKWLKENIEIEDESKLETKQGVIECLSDFIGIIRRSQDGSGRELHWLETDIRGDEFFVLTDNDLNELYVGDTLEDARNYLQEYGCDNEPAKIFRRVIIEEEV